MDISLMKLMVTKPRRYLTCNHKFSLVENIGYVGLNKFMTLIIKARYCNYSQTFCINN